MQPLTKARALKTGNIPIATVLAYVLIPLSGLATDIYLPSMPHMATGLRVSEQSVQLTLSLFLISYGLSQCIVGSLLDTFGRYRLSLVSLLLFSVSCFLIAITDNINLILAMRVVQGITVGFILVAKRALFVDVYSGDKQKKYVSIITIVWGVAPILAPYIGCYLEGLFNWRANFYFLGLFGSLLFVLELLFSGETLPQRSEPRFAAVIHAYRMMLGQRSFTWGLLMLGISYGTVMLYGLSGTFILEHKMGYSAIAAGYISLLLGSAWMAGGFLGKFLIGRPLLRKTAWATGIQLAAAGLLIASAAFSNIYILIFGAYILHMAAGFTFTNYFARSITMFPQNAAMAGGITGGGAYIVTSTLSYGVTYLIRAENQAQLGYSYLVLVVLGILVLATFPGIRKPGPVKL